MHACVYTCARVACAVIFMHVCAHVCVRVLWVHVCVHSHSKEKRHFCSHGNSSPEPFETYLIKGNLLLWAWLLWTCGSRQGGPRSCLEASQTATVPARPPPGCPDVHGQETLQVTNAHLRLRQATGHLCMLCTYNRGVHTRAGLAVCLCAGACQALLEPEPGTFSSRAQPLCSGPGVSVPGTGVSAECTCFPKLSSSVALSPRYHITAIGVPERPEAQGTGMGVPSWL